MSRSSSFLYSSSSAPDLVIIAFWSHCSNLDLFLGKLKRSRPPSPPHRFYPAYLSWQSSARKFCDKMKYWKTVTISFILSSFIFNVNFGRFCAADWRPAMTWLTIDRFTQDGQAKPKTSLIGYLREVLSLRITLTCNWKIKFSSTLFEVGCNIRCVNKQVSRLIRGENPVLS